MAQVLINSVISAEDLEFRFCDPNSVKSNSDRKLTLSSIDPLSKIGPWEQFLKETTNTDDINLGDLFNLPEQRIIDEDCQRLIDEGEIPKEKKEQKLLALRKVINVYSKSEKETYKPGNGWIPLLGRIISEHDSILDIYTSFKKIKDTYVPTPQTHGFILMLLLRYHDPSFYNWINDHDISLDQCTVSWFNSLFAENCTKPVCDLLWESFINCKDSFRIFFIALSIILLQKSNIEKKESNAKEKIKDTIKLFPNFINTRDLEDILENTKKFDINTPPFFREVFGSFMFGDQREPTPKWLPLLLPLSVISILENLRSLRLPNIVSDYFIVDCRPSHQYEGGHFSFRHKYHVDCNVLSKSSTGMYTIDDIQLLITRIEEAENILRNKEIHICLIGSNLVTNDKCVHTVAQELLKRNRKYVSMLYGGYEIIHSTLKVYEEFDDHAIDHDEKKCIVCSPTKKKLTDHLRKKLIKSKRRLLNCVNPMDDNCENISGDMEYKFHVADRDKNVLNDKEPISRTESTASTDSDIHGVANPSISNKSQHSSDHDSLQHQTQFKIVSKNEWLTLPNVMKFKCKEITSDGRKFESMLLITDTNLIHLRLIKDFKENAYLIVNCHVFFILNVLGSEYNNQRIVISFDESNNNRLNAKALIPFSEIRYKIREKEKFIQSIKAKFNELEGRYLE